MSDLAAFDAASVSSSPSRIDRKANTIVGRVTRLHFQSIRWCAGKLTDDQDRDISFNVKSYVMIGDRVTLTGKWVNDTEKWGWQFNATKSDTDLTLAPEGISAWIVWNVDGVGAKRAAQLIERYGIEVMDRFASHPDEIATFTHIPANAVRAAAALWVEQRGKVGIITALASYGLTESQCERIFDEYGDGALNVLQNDPYDIAGVVEGIGFKLADEIAAKLGITGTDPRRLRGGLAAFVRERHSNGHTATPLSLALTRAAELLDTTPELVEEQVAPTIAAKRIVRLGQGHVTRDVLASFTGARNERAIWDVLQGARQRNPLAPCREGEESEYAEGYRQCGTITLGDDQLAAVVNALRYRITALSGSAGSGKCLGRGTQVMLYSGRIVPVESIKVGDELMGPDSLPRKVLETNVGVGPLYRITPIKGDSWVCNDAHVMTLKGTNSKMGQTIDVELSKHLARDTVQRPDRDWKLFRVPLEFDEQAFPYHPYLIGVWLGDGTKSSTTLTLGYDKSPVKDWVVEYAKSIGMFVNVTDHPKTNCVSVAVNANDGRGPKANFLNKYYQIDCLSEGYKSIPSCYLFNSRKNRLELLAGLLDTDGSLGTGGYDYVTSSSEMSDQIVYLCRSLGFAAYMSPKFVQLDGWDSPRKYYRISISGDMSVVPCKVEHKKSPPRKQIKNHLVTGWTAEPIGEGDFFGFNLDGDGRFLLGDFTVTHNSSIARAIIKAFLPSVSEAQIHLAAPTGKASKRLSVVVGMNGETIHRLLEWRGKQKGFGYGPENLLPRGLYVLDEMSMTDSSLAYHFFSALGEDSACVLIGDIEQLPPVGPGAVLRDILAHQIAPVTRLTTTHRQAGTLLHCINAILAGEVRPTFPSLTGAPPWVLDGTCDTDHKVLSTILDYHERILPGWDYDAEEWVFLAPKLDGPLGVRRINLVLQYLNQKRRGNKIAVPGKAKEDWIKRPVFHVGDRVIATKNDYNLAYRPLTAPYTNADSSAFRGVMNGNAGVVTGVDPLTVLYTDLGTVVYGSKSEAADVQLAYCLSAHRFQGSQLRCIIVIVPKGCGGFVTRNWLYTAASRATLTTAIIGDGPTIREAAQRTTDNERETVLNWLALQGENDG